MGEGDVSLSDRSKPGNTITLRSNRKIPVNCLKRIRVPLKGVKRPIVHLRVFCNSAHSMGNKQKELETMLQIENCDLISVREMW